MSARFQKMCEDWKTSGRSPGFGTGVREKTPGLSLQCAATTGLCGDLRHMLRRCQCYGLMSVIKERI